MTYKQAKTIQSLVFELASTWDEMSFNCATNRIPYETRRGDWECVLFSYTDSDFDFLRLTLLAHSIEDLSPLFTTKITTYNCGTIEEKIVKAISIR